MTNQKVRERTDSLMFALLVRRDVPISRLAEIAAMPLPEVARLAIAGAKLLAARELSRKKGVA